MFDYRRIEATHLCIWPGKKFPVFLKEGIINKDFFRRACDANGDLFNDSRFNRNVNLNGGGDVDCVSFFKINCRRDRVVKPIYMPRKNKILVFDCAHGGLDRGMKGLLWKEKGLMMECIPWEIWDSEFLHDISIAVKNVRIQGILGGDRGNYQWVNVIVLKGWGCRGYIVYRVWWITWNKPNVMILCMVPHSLGDRWWNISNISNVRLTREWLRGLWLRHLAYYD